MSQTLSACGGARTLDASVTQGVLRMRGVDVAGFVRAARHP